MQFYADDWAKVYNGDCLEGVRDIPAASVDLVVTDPPYNIGKNYGPGTDDSRDPALYWKWFTEVFAEVYRVGGRLERYISRFNTESAG